MDILDRLEENKESGRRREKDGKEGEAQSRKESNGEKD